MTFKGRSPDDMPLAAYSTGMEPSEPDEADASEPDAGRDDTAAATPARDLDFDAGPFATADPESKTVHVGGLADDRPPFAELLRNPRAHARDPRLLLGGVIAVGVVLLGLSLLGGGGPGPATGANPSPSAGIGAQATALPAGNASVAVTGDIAATYELLGRTGIGPAVQSRMTSTWGDNLGNTLALGGPVSAGTRTTDATFVLTWSVMVDGAPVTFTSKAGECTVGMAVTPRNVSGSFNCKKLKSDDGEHTVEATGTYRT